MNYCRQLAADRGGECLDLKYHGTRDRYRWKCGAGHEFTMGLGVVQGGSWCQACFISLKRKTSPIVNGVPQLKAHGALLMYSIDDCKALASIRNGKFLSLVFKKSRDLYLWECADGHQWRAAFTSVKDGTWCKTCYLIKDMRYTPDEVKEISSSKGFFSLTSEKYVSLNVKNLQFKCKLCNRVSTRTFKSILDGGACHACGPISLDIELERERADSYVKERGGKIIDWGHSITLKSKFECSAGHRWLSSWCRVSSNNSWCGKCRTRFSSDTQIDEKRQWNLSVKAFNGYAARDKLKGRVCDIDALFVFSLRRKPCEYCGRTSTGADRIDNNIGHIKSNCVPCCVRCNWVRGNWLSFEIMKQVGKLLSEIDP